MFLLAVFVVIVSGAAVNAYRDGPYVPPPAPEPDDPSGDRWVRCDDGSFIKASEIRE